MILASLVASITGKNGHEQSTDQPAESGSHSDGPSPFADVTTEQTISDVVSASGATDNLPDQWKLKFDLRYDQSDILTEVAIIHHPSHPAQFELKAAETYEPLGETHVAIESTNTQNRHLTTTDRFEEACEIIQGYLAKIEKRSQTKQSTEDEWNNAGPARLSSQNRPPATA